MTTETAAPTSDAFTVPPIEVERVEKAGYWLWLPFPSETVPIGIGAATPAVGECDDCDYCYLSVRLALGGSSEPSQRAAQADELLCRARELVIAGLALDLTPDAIAQHGDSARLDDANCLTFEATAIHLEARLFGGEYFSGARIWLNKPFDVRVVGSFLAGVAVGMSPSFEKLFVPVAMA